MFKYHRQRTLNSLIRLMLSNEQLEFRRYRVGSSDIPIIMGVSPYKSPTINELWEQKVYGLSSPGNDQMSKGDLMEPVIIDMFYKKNPQFNDYGERGSLEPKSVGLVGDWKHATLDHGVGGIHLECKYVDYHSDAWLDNLPPYVLLQVLWQRHVFMMQRLGIRSFVVAWSPNWPDDGYKQFEVVEEKRHKEVLERAVEAGRKFISHVYWQTPPDPADPAFRVREQLRREPKDNGMMKERSREAEILMAEYRDALEESEQAKSRSDRCKALLIEHVGPFAGVEGLFTYKHDKNGRRNFRLKEK